MKEHRKDGRHPAHPAEPAMPAPPTGLEAWQCCGAEIDRNLAETTRARAHVAAQRQALLLAAARGNAEARRRLRQLAEREDALQSSAATASEALAQVRREIAAAEAQALAAGRRVALDAFEGQLRDRLALVGEVEDAVHALGRALKQLAAAGAAASDTYHALGGPGKFQPPLGQEATAGRLCEYMSGLGFDGWLPLPRPEARPPVASLLAAETAAQECYRLPD